LEQESFQEGAAALVVGREPGSAGLGWVEASVERVTERGPWLRRELERAGPFAPGAEVRVRHGADGLSLLAALGDGVLTDTVPELDGPGPGSPQAGALGVLVERMRDPRCEELFLVGAEHDEVGVLHWRR
jgi:hypothetical protein